jgi:hypothetical protein
MTQPIGGPTRSVSWTDLNLGDGNDDVRISRASGADGLKGLFEVSINGKVQLMTKEQLEHTRFNLNGGNDTWWFTRRSTPESRPSVDPATTCCWVAPATTTCTAAPARTSSRGAAAPT